MQRLKADLLKRYYMPKLFVYGTDREFTTQITLDFARGAVNYNNSVNGNWEVKHIPISNYLENGLPNDLDPETDAVATLGILRGTGLMLKEAKSRDIDYYYIDHAYYNPGYKKKCWLRITKNAHACTTLKDVDSTKFNSYDQYHIENWRTNAQRGKKILVLPPTDAVGWFFDAKDWEHNTVAKIQQHMPDSKIVIRHKPKEPIVDERGFLIRLETGAESNPPLEQQLDECFCVVAYNSMVALQATLMGIPVIVNEHSCCTRVSFSFEDLATPDVFNTEPQLREKLVWWLPHNQWKKTSIQDGTAWREINEC